MTDATLTSNLGTALEQVDAALRVARTRAYRRLDPDRLWVELGETHSVAAANRHHAGPAAFYREKIQAMRRMVRHAAGDVLAPTRVSAVGLDRDEAGRPRSVRFWVHTR